MITTRPSGAVAFDERLHFPDEHQLGLDVLVRVSRNTLGSVTSLARDAVPE